MFPGASSRTASELTVSFMRNDMKDTRGKPLIAHPLWRPDILRLGWGCLPSFEAMILSMLGPASFAAEGLGSPAPRLPVCPGRSWPSVPYRCAARLSVSLTVVHWKGFRLPSPHGGRALRNEADAEAGPCVSPLGAFTPSGDARRHPPLRGAPNPLSPRRAPGADPRRFYRSGPARDRRGPRRARRGCRPSWCPSRGPLRRDQG